MDIACAPDVLTMNMTHTGELGYVFYIPNEFAIHVYDSIMEEGKKFGLKHCGYYAQRAVRIEKFYAYWGQVRCPHLFLPEWKIWQKKYLNMIAGPRQLHHPNGMWPSLPM